MGIVSDLALPLTVVLFTAYGLLRKTDVFQSFLEGARKGIVSLYGIIPSILGLNFAVKLLRVSGIIEALSAALSPLLGYLGFPSELLPLSLLKSISGSGSTALLCDIFESFGTDSPLGLASSVICCSSETTFYTVAVYFGAVGIKKTRHTVAAALIADTAAVIFSVAAVKLFCRYALL